MFPEDFGLRRVGDLPVTLPPVWSVTLDVPVSTCRAIGASPSFYRCRAFIPSTSPVPWRSPGTTRRARVGAERDSKSTEGFLFSSLSRVESPVCPFLRVYLRWKLLSPGKSLRLLPPVPLRSPVTLRYDPVSVRSRFRLRSESLRPTSTTEG